jgi:CelD/BcsL family acetyltransferase involved in cellulose biosynthesis
MAIYLIDPLRDPRWDAFLQAHSQASVFHTKAWLQALRTTYRYEPVAFTDAAPDTPLANAIVFCRVRSFLTGSRLVSVPFADHCDPLVSGRTDLNDLLAEVERVFASQSSQYLELRCTGATAADLDQRATLSRNSTFAHHILDLNPDLEILFRSLHKSCIQRKVRRAEREELVYEEGASDQFVRQFYGLQVLTRRRHGLPPQPLAWFLNLRDSFREDLKVRLVSKDDQPIAGIVTLRHKQAIVYKYGASDAQFHNLGAMPLLFWRTIRESKELGLSKIDLGRSDLDEEGLIAFKNHLGAHSSVLSYYRYPADVSVASSRQGASLARRFCTHLPSPLLRVVGSAIYRHIG